MYPLLFEPKVSMGTLETAFITYLNGDWHCTLELPELEYHAETDSYSLLTEAEITFYGMRPRKNNWLNSFFGFENTETTYFEIGYHNIPAMVLAEMQRLYAEHKHKPSTPPEYELCANRFKQVQGIETAKEHLKDGIFQAFLKDYMQETLLCLVSKDRTLSSFYLRFSNEIFRSGNKRFSVEVVR